jgi:hypothetical protein
MKLFIAPSAPQGRRHLLVRCMGFSLGCSCREVDPVPPRQVTLRPPSNGRLEHVKSRWHQNGGCATRRFPREVGLSCRKCGAADGPRDFRFLLFFPAEVSPLHRPLEPRSQAIESRPTAIAVEVSRRAPSLLVSRPFVAHGVAHGGRGAWTGDGSFRGFRWPQRARRRAQRPPVLLPPTAPAPTIA